jgi:hypothetical protein
MLPRLLTPQMPETPEERLAFRTARQQPSRLRHPTPQGASNPSVMDAAAHLPESLLSQIAPSLHSLDALQAAMRRLSLRVPATQTLPLPAAQTLPLPATQTLPAAQTLPLPATQTLPLPATQTLPLPATQTLPLPGWRRRKARPATRWGALLLVPPPTPGPQAPTHCRATPQAPHAACR